MVWLRRWLRPPRGLNVQLKPCWPRHQILLTMRSEEAVRILRQLEGSQPEGRRFLAMALTTWAPSTATWDTTRWSCHHGRISALQPNGDWRPPRLRSASPWPALNWVPRSPLPTPLTWWHASPQDPSRRSAPWAALRRRIAPRAGPIWRSLAWVGSAGWSKAWKKVLSKPFGLFFAISPWLAQSSRACWSACRWGCAAVGAGTPHHCHQPQ